MEIARTNAAHRRILALLKSGLSLTSREAAERAFVSGSSGRHVMLSMYRDTKTVFVSNWIRENDRGPWMAQYQIRLGKEVDAAKPEPLTTMQKQRRYREQLKKEDRIKARSSRTIASNGPAPVRPDPWSLALFPWMYCDAAKAAGAELEFV